MIPTDCRFRGQGSLESFVDHGTSPLWQDFAATAKFDRTDAINPSIAQSGHDCFLAGMGYRALGRGKAMLNYCRIRTDILGCELDRSPHKQCDFRSWKLHAECMEETPEIRTRGGKYATPIPAARVYRWMGGLR